MKFFGGGPEAISAATAIEYAMIASMVSIVIFAGVSSIGQTVKHFFAEVIVPAL